MEKAAYFGWLRYKSHRNALKDENITMRLSLQ